MKETPEERCARILAKYSKTLPRIFGDPLQQEIGTPDIRLVNQSLGHISAYALGYVQELAARVKALCEEPRETQERKREACQLLVNIARGVVADMNRLIQQFPEPFRAIAETSVQFPCLFPAHPEQRAALNKFLLEDLALGKLNPLKLRPPTARKTFSTQGYVNKLLLHYRSAIHRERTDLLSFRLDYPLASAAIPRQEIERLVDEIPLCVANVKPWMKVIWHRLLGDWPQPETHEKLKSLGNRASRRGRATHSGVDALVGLEGVLGSRLPKARKGASEALLVRAAIREALEKYLVRMLRKDDQSTPDK